MISEKGKELKQKINNEEIDLNDQSLFISLVLKALVWQLNKTLSIRGISVPHYIVNTGDDILYLENKGQDNSLEPWEISNESYIYDQVPKCVVTLNGLEMLGDQLTNPHVRGNCEIEYNGELYNVNAEFYRLPLKISIQLKYYLESFTDTLSCAQQLMSKLFRFQRLNISYLGQTILASTERLDALSPEMNIEFDGGTTDSKARTISCDVTLETCMPIYNNKTCVLGEEIISSMTHEMTYDNEVEIKHIPKENDIK